MCDEPAGAFDYQTSKEIIALMEQFYYDSLLTFDGAVHFAPILQLSAQRLP